MRLLFLFLLCTIASVISMQQPLIKKDVPSLRTLVSKKLASDLLDNSTSIHAKLQAKAHIDNDASQLIVNQINPHLQQLCRDYYIWQSSKICAICCSSTGARIFIGFNNGTAKIVNCLFEHVSEILLNAGARIVKAIFSHDEQFVAIATADADILIFNVATGALVHQLPRIAGQETHDPSAQFNHAGSVIVTINNGIACLWDFSVSPTRLVKTFNFDENVLCAVFSADDNILYLGCSDGKLRLYTITDEQLAEQTLVEMGNISQITLSADQKQAICLFWNTIRVYDCTDMFLWKLTTEINECSDWNVLQLSSDGKYIFTIYKQEIHVWEAGNGNYLTTHMFDNPDDTIKIAKKSITDYFFERHSFRIIDISFNAITGQLLIHWNNGSVRVNSPLSFNLQQKIVLQALQNGIDSATVVDVQQKEVHWIYQSLPQKIRACVRDYVIDDTTFSSKIKPAKIRSLRYLKDNAPILMPKLAWCLYLGLLVGGGAMICSNFK